MRMYEFDRYEWAHTYRALYDYIEEMTYSENLALRFKVYLDLRVYDSDVYEWSYTYMLVYDCIDGVT